MIDTDTWADTYNHAVELFGEQRPTRALEEQLLTIYRDRPTDVHAAIERLAHRYRDGKIRSPWPILLTELRQDEQRAAATPSRDEARALHLAETWIRNAGCHVDREPEIIDELFGPRGLLAGLQAQHGAAMLELWRQERPRGIASDNERLERARRFREARTPQTTDDFGDEA